MKVVLDTNVLVSAILANGPPATIADLVAGGKLRPFYNDAIISEYWNVLHRRKFDFQSSQIDRLLNTIIRTGLAVEINTPSSFPMIDEEDRKFYDVAKTSRATLITGNIRHFPKKSFIVTPAVFLRTYQISN